MTANIFPNHSSRFVWMHAKYSGNCVRCGTMIEEQDEIAYDPHIKKAYCVACGMTLDRGFTGGF